ncbi:MAG: class I SAM-dependent methyltransferase [Bacillota bacterium]|jgi:glycosyltransferase involved in cell wall biosynthesis
MAVKKPKSILRGYYNIYKNINADFGGGSYMSKTYLMAYLIESFNLKYYIEIGVYKGKSLLPLSYVVGQNNGKAIGIDPYEKETAKEYDLDENKKELINSFIDNLDFDSIYHDVIMKIENFGLNDYCKIIRKKSSEAVADLIKNKIKIDILHIDGNHDSVYVQEDADKYLPLVNEGGFVIFDDIDWNSVDKIYKEVKKHNYIPVFESETFGILMKNKRTLTNLDKCERLNKKLSYLSKKISRIEKELEDGSYDNKVPHIGVGILTYNHQDYIEECLDGVFCQAGNYKVNVFILDDHSTDYTYDLIKKYIKDNRDNIKDFNIQVIQNEKNFGVVNSFKKLTEFLRGFDYVTICEGDDYWCDQYRIQKHIDFLREKPECVLSFNGCNVYYQDIKKTEFSEIHKTLKKNRYTTEDLMHTYIIGNESCAFYDGQVFDNLPDDLFNLFIGDWMFNIFCSSFGDIGYLPDIMNVYRKHNGGIWSCVDNLKRAKMMIKNVDEYNRYTNFMFDKEFTAVINQSLLDISSQYAEDLNLVVVDDIFPLSLSGFRYQEFTSYLSEIENTKVLCTGQTVPQFIEMSIDELIIEYKRKYPEFSRKVNKFERWIPNNCRLLYFIFPTNAYNCLDIIEQYGIPFVFTLYPGGGFLLNNIESDNRLKRLMDSPCFKRVIVTQQVTYDYLLNKNFCSKDQIDFIFGGVMPLAGLNLLHNYKKKHYDIDKENLDICFMAQKYSKYGRDKGYDVFIEVAKILSKAYKNITFHVIGSFDEETIDVSDIKDSIKFYGMLNIYEFDDFFIDKDIILSPNVPNILANGAFDGFPTGSCVEAGLRKTAVFCTDILNLNGDRIRENEEIVIVPHNALEISKIISYYYNNPDALKQICENGQKKLLDIYSYESQIKPRIEILKSEITQPFELTIEDKLKIKSLSRVNKKHFLDSIRVFLIQRYGQVYMDYCPDQIKKVYKGVKRIIRNRYIR